MQYFAILLIFFILTAETYALRCDKCHRDDKDLNKIIKEKEITTKEELFSIIRKGKFSKLHKNLTDEEISEASKIFNLK